jgi:hypothetical protein
VLTFDLATLPLTRARLWEWALKTSCQTTINLSRLELREQLVHRQSGVLLRLKNGLTVRSSVCKSFTALSWSSYNPPLPHLVVLPIEVRRTRTPFLVCHLWILDWLESIKT